MRIVLASIALLSAAGAVHAVETTKPFKVELSWRLSLDAQGHVTQLNAVGKQPVDRVPKIRERLEKEIRNWQFTSGKLDGQPAPTETGLNVWLTIAVQDKDTVQMHVDKATTGVSVAQMIPPHYPPMAVKDHITGQVVLRIGYDASGRITSVEPEPSAPKASAVLVQSATKAVQSWSFQPENVGGYGRAGYVVTPFCYRLTEIVSGHTEGKCGWRQPNTSDSVAQGEALALDPAAKLQTDVAGHAL